LCGALTAFGRRWLAGGADWDSLGLRVALDPVPPISFELGVPGWAPTLQIVRIHSPAARAGIARAKTAANEVTANRMGETAFAGPAKGKLVAQASQFAAVRIPRS
jgi:hypothetical protein